MQALERLLKEKGYPAGVARVAVNGYARTILYYGAALWKWDRTIEWHQEVTAVYDPHKREVKYYFTEGYHGPGEAFRAIESMYGGGLLTAFLIPKDYLDELVDKERGAAA